MRHALSTAGLIVTLAAPALGQAPISAGSLQATSTRVGEIDLGKLKGDPWRLAWSPDGATLYLQTVERDRFGNAKEYHYTMPANGGEAQKVDAQPEWAAKYWTWKSAPSAPGLAAFKFDIGSRMETQRATSVPRGAGIAGMGGDTAPSGGGGGGRGEPGGGGGTSAGDAVNAAVQGQSVRITTLRLRNEIIAEYVNVPVTPGLSFGWAPQGRAAIAYADREGRLVVMDQEGGQIAHRRGQGRVAARLERRWEEDRVSAEDRAPEVQCDDSGDRREVTSTAAVG